MTTSMPLGAPKASDISMSPEVFGVISGLIRSEAGISIADSKLAMVKSRLTRRLRRLQISSFEEYVALVQSQAGASEREELISALTTNVSHFFREPHHFQTLRNTITPTLISKARAGKRIRIWSSACSNGQEPYSIAMALLDECPEIEKYDLKILATDIDPIVLKTAKDGIYRDAMLSGLDDTARLKHFDQISGPGEPSYRAKNQLRSMISFRRLNLISDWPMSGKFDVIFCRNVLIYFDEDVQRPVLKKFHNFLDDEGWLFLGHSERIPEEMVNNFSSSGVTTYKKQTLGSGYSKQAPEKPGGDK